jgi:hypothetical protein
MHIPAAKNELNKNVDVRKVLAKPTRREKWGIHAKHIGTSVRPVSTRALHSLPPR